MFDEEGQRGRGRKCCVLDGTVVRRLNHLPLYKYIILKSNYLINDSSSYELLALELDSIKPPGCRRVNGGWREEGISRDRLATDLIRSKVPQLFMPVSAPTVSREASRDFVAIDVYYIPGI